MRECTQEVQEKMESDEMDVSVSFTSKRIRDGVPELEDEEGRDGESPNSTSEGPSGSYMDNSAADEHNG